MTQDYYWCIMKHAKSDFDLDDGVVLNMFTYFAINLLR